jgi:hypothetical protein
MGKNQDHGSGINTPDPQHFIFKAKKKRYGSLHVGTITLEARHGIFKVHCPAIKERGYESINH